MTAAKIRVAILLAKIVTRRVTADVRVTSDPGKRAAILTMLASRLAKNSILVAVYKKM